jgi:predicted thioesterase
MIVTYKDTAAAYGSGKLEVFATPAMACLMENTAIKCLKGTLDEHLDTVGVAIDVKHVKATGVGKKVVCQATIAGVEGRRVRFTIEAWDEVATIGTAVHDRVIINPDEFMRKVE